MNSGKEIEKIVDAQLERVTGIYGKPYNTLNEAESVLREEFEEVRHAARSVFEASTKGMLSALKHRGIVPYTPENDAAGCCTETDLTNLSARLRHTAEECIDAMTVIKRLRLYGTVFDAHGKRTEEP